MAVERVADTEFKNLAFSQLATFEDQILDGKRMSYSVIA